MIFLLEWVGPVSETYRFLEGYFRYCYLSHLLLFCVLFKYFV